MLFTKHCAVCHALHGEGGKVGPDLTATDRKNRMYLLTNIIDPSGYIRPEFVTYSVLTKDDRKLSGLAVDPADGSIALVNVVNDKVVRDDRCESGHRGDASLAGVAHAGEVARYAYRTTGRGPVRVPGV